MLLLMDNTNMIQLNLQYEAIFDARNIDEECNKITDEINDVARMQINEFLAVGMYKQPLCDYNKGFINLVRNLVQ